MNNIGVTKLKPADINAGYMLIRNGEHFTFDKTNIPIGTGAGRELLVTSSGLYDLSTGEPITKAIPKENVITTILPQNQGKSETFMLCILALVAIVAIVALKK